MWRTSAAASFQLQVCQMPYSFSRSAAASGALGGVLQQ